MYRSGATDTRACYVDPSCLGVAETVLPLRRGGIGYLPGQLFSLSFPLRCSRAMPPLRKGGTRRSRWGDRRGWSPVFHNDVEKWLQEPRWFSVYSRWGHPPPPKWRRVFHRSVDKKRPAGPKRSMLPARRVFCCSVVQDQRLILLGAPHLPHRRQGYLVPAEEVLGQGHHIGPGDGVVGG